MNINSHIVLSPTELFLLDCSLFPQQDRVYSTHYTTHDLDWRSIIKEAHWHKLFEPLATYVTKLDIVNDLPFDARAAVVKHVKTANYHDLLFTTEITRISNLLNENKIPFVFLKGVALIPLLYRSTAVRGLRDFDILIKRGYDKQAFDLMVKELGYECFANEPTKRIFASYGCEHCILIHRRGFMVEIHYRGWHEELPFTDDTDNLVNSAQVVQFGNTSISCSSLEDLFIHLCIHLYCHHAYANDYHLRHHADIRNLLYKYHDKIDWEYIITKTNKLNAQLGVGYALYYTECIYGSLVSADILALIMPAILYHELEAIRANRLGKHNKVGIWNLPYLARLFSSDNRNRLKQLIDNAVAKQQYEQHTTQLVERYNIDANDLQGND